MLDLNVVLCDKVSVLGLLKKCKRHPPLLIRFFMRLRLPFGLSFFERYCFAHAQLKTSPLRCRRCLAPTLSRLRLGLRDFIISCLVNSDLGRMDVMSALPLFSVIALSCRIPPASVYRANDTFQTIYQTTPNARNN